MVLVSSLATAPAGDQGQKETMLTEKANNTTVRILKGEKLVIKLEGIPSAGFTWQVAKNNSEVLAFAGKVEIEKAKPGVIGGKAYLILRFTAKATGVSDVELYYRRPFEKDKQPEKIFKVKVEVADGPGGK
jgi:predicted secreted protein